MHTMRQFSVSTEIAAPTERVWQVMSDIERWPEWTPGVTSVVRRDRGPLGVGSRVVIRQPKFPPARWTVTALEPGRSFTWVSVAPGLRVVGHHAVEGIGAGKSRATLSLELEGVLGGLWGRLTREITERYIAFEAQGLKARSEGPQFRHGATRT